MNIYIKMQESVLKRADPDFNPMLKAKLGRIGGDIWIAFDAFAYCIPQKTFLLSDVGFGEFTSEGTRKLFGDAHGGEGKIKLEPTGITRRIDGHNVVEFYDATGNICFDEKLLKKFPSGCAVAVRAQDLGAKQRAGFLLDPVTSLCYGVIMEIKLRNDK